MADWHQGSNGTLVCDFTLKWCSNGVEVTHFASSSFQFDGSDADRVKLSWHLAEALSGTNITAFDWSAETKVKWFTGGLPRSSKEWPWIIHGSADSLIPTWDSNWQTSNSVPSINITVAGKTLDTNGDAVIVWGDNTTNECTPAVSGYSNYKYDVSATRVKVPLVFRASGELTQPDTNGVGYNLGTYNAVTSIVHTTTLGTGHRVPGGYFNFEETDGTVPINPEFDSGWKWHRDVAAGEWTFVRVGSNPGTLGPPALTNFSGGGGNDSGGPAPDETPDLNRLILTSDGPGKLIPSPTADSLAVVCAQRLYAREWLTWNGAEASDVLRWRSFVTFRKLPYGDWELKGQNLLEPTPAGDAESPTFTAEEAAAVLDAP